MTFGWSACSPRRKAWSAFAGCTPTCRYGPPASIMAWTKMPLFCLAWATPGIARMERAS